MHVRKSEGDIISKQFKPIRPGIDDSPVDLSRLPKWFLLMGALIVMFGIFFLVYIPEFIIIGVVVSIVVCGIVGVIYFFKKKN